MSFLNITRICKGFCLSHVFLVGMLLAWTVHSFSQVGVSEDESKPSESENPSNSETEQDGVLNTNPDASPSEPGQSPDQASGASPAGGRNSPVISTPAAILPSSLPSVSLRAMNVKRDRGDLSAMGKLSEIKGLLKDPSAPIGFSDLALGSVARLFEDSHSKGNRTLVGELFENDPSWSDVTALAVGGSASLLLADHSLKGDLSPVAVFQHAELSANDFALDVTSVWDHLASDAFPSASFSATAGRNLALSSGTYAYDSLVSGNADTFLVAATSNLSLSGSIEFKGESDRVVLIGGESVASASGLKLDVALADLSVASRSDWTVEDAAFSAGSRIYLRSLGDLTVNDVDLSSSDQVRLEALMTLSLDSARFSSGLREVMMRATTIDLTNVDFPSAATVNMQTLKGATDGKYPTFGLENRSYGRVNFLKNVSHGGNPIMDRSSFDLHGTKINITKLP